MGVGELPVHPVLLVESLQVSKVDGGVRGAVDHTVRVGESAHAFELEREDALVWSRRFGGIVVTAPELDPRILQDTWY